MKPIKGNAKTFCFADAKTGAHIAIPIGASPGASLEELRRGIGSSQKRFGPYIVKRYGSENVDCTTTIAEPALKSEILIVVGIERRADELQRINKNAVDNLTANYGVAFNVVKMNGKIQIDADDAPYIDELTGMQARTVYFFNQKNKTLVRIKKELRKTVVLPYMLNNISGYKGIIAEIEFRFCKDMLNPEAKDVCEKAKP